MYCGHLVVVLPGLGTEGLGYHGQDTAYYPGMSPVCSSDVRALPR